MTETILFVDDEPSVLHAVRRIFADDALEVIVAASGEEALKIIRERAVSVIISDNMMPGMTGIEFLERSRAVSPDSVRVLLTGYSDVHAAIDAINRGAVYRFLTKPWDNEVLRKTVLDGVNEHSVIMTMRHADESKLLSLAQTIELKDHYTRGHCENVAKYALVIAEHAGLAGDGIRQVKYASWLHDCGKIGVPEAILNFPGRLTDEMMLIVKKHSEWGADVARKAALPAGVVDMILHHHERYDGGGYPRGLAGDQIPLGARILAIADVYDALTTERPYRAALAAEEARRILREGRGTWFDPALLDIFFRHLGEERV